MGLVFIATREGDLGLGHSGLFKQLARSIKPNFLIIFLWWLKPTTGKNALDLTAREPQPLGNLVNRQWNFNIFQHEF